MTGFSANASISKEFDRHDNPSSPAPLRVKNKARGEDSVVANATSPIFQPGEDKIKRALEFASEHVDVEAVIELGIAKLHSGALVHFCGKF